MQNNQAFATEIGKIAQKITAYGHILEPALGGAALLLILLQMGGIDAGSFLLFAVLLPLSTYYFLEAYAPQNTTKPLKLFFNKILSLGCSILLAGLLFHFNLMQGAKAIILAGALSLVTALIFKLSMRQEDNNEAKNDKRKLIRMVVLLLISASIFFMS